LSNHAGSIQFLPAAQAQISGRFSPISTKREVVQPGRRKICTFLLITAATAILIVTPADGHAILLESTPSLKSRSNRNAPEHSRRKGLVGLQPSLYRHRRSLDGAAGAGCSGGKNFPGSELAAGLFRIAGILLLRSDPETWPLGPVGFWATLADPEVLLHCFLAVLVIAQAIRMARADGPRCFWRSRVVFHVLIAISGALLLTHSHSLGSIKEEVLAELSHIRLAVLAITAGWWRWLVARQELAEEFWFRDVDSNHDTQLQRLMSYRLDDPGTGPISVAEACKGAQAPPLETFLPIFT
jgi:hypothetical protein